MSCSFPLLVTAHQDRFIHVWDLNQAFQQNNFNPREVTESPLKYATTAIACFGDGKGYAVGSASLACFLLFSAFMDEVSAYSGKKFTHVDIAVRARFICLRDWRFQML